MEWSTVAQSKGERRKEEKGTDLYLIIGIIVIGIVVIVILRGFNGKRSKLNKACN